MKVRKTNSYAYDKNVHGVYFGNKRKMPFFGQFCRLFYPCVKMEAMIPLLHLNKKMFWNSTEIMDWSWKEFYWKVMQKHVQCRMIALNPKFPMWRKEKDSVGCTVAVVLSHVAFVC